jgi:hypothetical protein
MGDKRYLSTENRGEQFALSLKIFQIPLNISSGTD